MQKEAEEVSIFPEEEFRRVKGTYQIVALSEEQIAEAGEALTRAFMEDPLTVYAIPDPQERAEKFIHFFTDSVRESFVLQGVYVTSGKTEGVAVWMPPDAGGLSTEQAQEAGEDPLRALFGEAAYRRFTDVFSYMGPLHSQHVPGSHWYLALLGVVPGHQGQGIGSALLTRVLQQADRDGLPCYLETFQPEAVRLYERHGFRSVADGLEPHSQLPFWAMKRDPRS